MELNTKELLLSSIREVENCKDFLRIARTGNIIRDENNELIHADGLVDHVKKAMAELVMVTAGRDGREAGLSDAITYGMAVHYRTADSDNCIMAVTSLVAVEPDEEGQPLDDVIVRGFSDGENGFTNPKYTSVSIDDIKDPEQLAAFILRFADSGEAEQEPQR